MVLNGMAISGATSASYTTPVLTFENNNEQFSLRSVTVPAA
jgi:hypothetical protein